MSNIYPKYADNVNTMKTVIFGNNSFGQDCLKTIEKGVKKNGQPPIHVYYDMNIEQKRYH